MRADVIRMVADFFGDATSGVNALIPQVPRDVTVDEPAAVAIADETRNGWVARGETPRAESLTGPTLAIYLLEPIAFSWNEDSAAQTYHSADVAIAVRYIAANVDSEVGNVAAAITLRAVRGSVIALCEPNSLSSRERNLVRILRCASIEELPAFENKEDVVIASGLKLHFDVIDVIPTFGT